MFSEMSSCGVLSESIANDYHLIQEWLQLQHLHLCYRFLGLMMLFHPHQDAEQGRMVGAAGMKIRLITIYILNILNHKQNIHQFTEHYTLYYHSCNRKHIENRLQKTYITDLKKKNWQAISALNPVSFFSQYIVPRIKKAFGFQANVMPINAREFYCTYSQSGLKWMAYIHWTISPYSYKHYRVWKRSIPLSFTDYCLLSLRPDLDYGYN